MTTVVPTSEEDPALAVVRFTSELAWADAGPEVPTPISLTVSMRVYIPKIRHNFRFLFVDVSHIGDSYRNLWTWGTEKFNLVVNSLFGYWENVGNKGNCKYCNVASLPICLFMLRLVYVLEIQCAWNCLSWSLVRLPSRRWLGFAWKPKNAWLWTSGSIWPL